MAHSDTLPPEVLLNIARQISGGMPRATMLGAPAARPALGESLIVAVLPLDRLREGDGGLADRVLMDGYWHHQIYAGTRATGFARSRAVAEAAGEEHRVVEVVNSDLPEAVREAIEWTDENVRDDEEARLLEVPSYGVTAIWLTGAGADSVVVAAMPARIGNLSLKERIPEFEFIDRLARNVPIAGLGRLRDDDAATF